MAISKILLIGKDTEVTAVEVELDRISHGKEGAKKAREQQLSLFKALTKDISEATVGLVAKLNCESKRMLLTTM